jgi:hypothetical protein
MEPISFGAFDLDGAVSGRWAGRSLGRVLSLAALCVFHEAGMVDEDFWRTVQDKDLVTSQSRRTGVLNLSLLFGTAVIALTLILTPMLSSKKDKRMLANTPIDYDNISTGSIPSGGTAKRYTVRRSVLQEMPGAVCIIDADGSKSGC